MFLCLFCLSAADKGSESPYLPSMSHRSRVGSPQAQVSEDEFGLYNSHVSVFDFMKAVGACFVKNDQESLRALSHLIDALTEAPSTVALRLGDLLGEKIREARIYFLLPQEGGQSPYPRNIRECLSHWVVR